MNKERSKRKGLLSIEIIVAIGLMITLIGVIAALGHSYGQLNQTLWQRHTCITAGQAQLDAIAMRGRPIPEDKFHELWPHVTCSIERTDGQGDWLGFEQVQIHLTAKSKKRNVRLSLNRYLPKDKSNKVQP